MKNVIIVIIMVAAFAYFAAHIFIMGKKILDGRLVTISQMDARMAEGRQ